MEEIQNLKEKEEKLRITYEALLDETDNLFPADTVEELEENMQIPKAQIAILVDRIGKTRNKMQSLETKLS